MSKERLEEIQNEVNYAYRRNGSISTKAVTMPIEHYEHLYEQAELVEELEQQNKRYREAIEKIKKKISKQLEGLDAEEEMQRVMELSELMTMAVGSLKEENFSLTQTSEQLDLFGEESE